MTVKHRLQTTWAAIINLAGRIFARWRKEYIKTPSSVLLHVTKPAAPAETIEEALPGAAPAAPAETIEEALPGAAPAAPAETIEEALLTLLREYSTGSYSNESLAEHLTACGCRTRLGKPFTKGGVEHVLKNRFYEKKVIFHPGQSDEHIGEGKHEVPDEVRELWLRCQEIRRQRAKHIEGRPRLPNRSYIFSKVAVCDQCNGHYGGQPSHRNSGRVIRRLCHARPFCELRPHSVRVENLVARFQVQVLPYITLDNGWKSTILNALNQGRADSFDDETQVKIERALKNLRKQHLWGDITDEEYRQEKQELGRQINNIPLSNMPANLSNLDRAAQLLSDLPSLWEHPSVTDEQREVLIREMFEEIHLRGSSLVSIKPKQEYQPLFAYFITEGVRKSRGERI